MGAHVEGCEPLAHERSEEDEVVSSPNEEAYSLREGPEDVSDTEECQRPAPDREEEEFQPDDEGREHTTDFDESGSELEEGDYPMPIQVPRTKRRSAAKVDGDLRPRSSCKRQLRPVIRLTYDEPGEG